MILVSFNIFKFVYNSCFCRKRTSGFDMVPPGAAIVAGAGAPGMQ